MTRISQQQLESYLWAAATAAFNAEETMIGTLRKEGLLT